MSGRAPGGAPAVRILAPAKINVGLAVLGRRADGYHELRTLFQAISLADRITVRPRRRGVLVRCPALPGLGIRNLAHRAAELFLAETGVRGGLEIEVEKRIPAGGGLGGGSSDAAAVLLGASRLCGLRPAAGRLEALAAALGSDVAFFLRGGSAVAAGRGELLTPIPALSAPPRVLLYLPPEGLATAAVYGRLDPAALTGRERALSIVLARWRDGDLGRLGAALFNDLEAAAFALDPALAEVKEGLRGAGAAGALLCGSGSSVYGLFADRAKASGAVRLLRGRFPGRFVHAVFLPPRRHWGVVKR